jgi:hypothetical protein
MLHVHTCTCAVVQDYRNITKITNVHRVIIERLIHTGLAPVVYYCYHVLCTHTYTYNNAVDLEIFVLIIILTNYHVEDFS